MAEKPANEQAIFEVARRLDFVEAREGDPSAQRIVTTIVSHG